MRRGQAFPARQLLSIVYEVRSTFPNLVCGKGCDFMVKCEQLGHYVGFRTAEESKAEREGRLIGDDLRD